MPEPRVLDAKRALLAHWDLPHLCAAKRMVAHGGKAYALTQEWHAKVGSGQTVGATFGLLALDLSTFELEHFQFPVEFSGIPANFAHEELVVSLQQCVDDRLYFAASIDDQAALYVFDVRQKTWAWRDGGGVEYPILQRTSWQRTRGSFGGVRLWLWSEDSRQLEVHVQREWGDGAEWKPNRLSPETVAASERAIQARGQLGPYLICAQRGQTITLTAPDPSALVGPSPAGAAESWVVEGLLDLCGGNGYIEWCVREVPEVEHQGRRAFLLVVRNLDPKQGHHASPWRKDHAVLLAARPVATFQGHS